MCIQHMKNGCLLYMGPKIIIFWHLCILLQFAINLSSLITARQKNTLHHSQHDKKQRHFKTRLNVTIYNKNRLCSIDNSNKSQVTFIKLMSSALSKTIWMELSSFLASCCFWWSCRACAEFSWQNLEWALSRTSRVFPRSSSRSCCIFWYCSCTSSFRCCTLSWGSTDQHKTITYYASLVPS